MRLVPFKTMGKAHLPIRPTITILTYYLSICSKPYIVEHHQTKPNKTTSTHLVKRSHIIEDILLPKLNPHNFPHL